MSNNFKCTICAKPAERAHIKSRGAGAGWEDWEWVYLCRSHHVEQHKIGIITFIRKYPQFFSAIKAKGWILFNGKLIHETIDN